MMRSTLGRISGLALGLGALALFIYVVGLDELRKSNSSSESGGHDFHDRNPTARSNFLRFRVVHANPCNRAQNSISDVPRNLVCQYLRELHVAQRYFP